MLDGDPFGDSHASSRRQHLQRNAYSANDLASMANEPELDLQFMGSLPRIPETSGGPWQIAVMGVLMY